MPKETSQVEKSLNEISIIIDRISSQIHDYQIAVSEIPSIIRPGAPYYRRRAEFPRSHLREIANFLDYSAKLKEALFASKSDLYLARNVMNSARVAIEDLRDRQKIFIKKYGVDQWHNGLPILTIDSIEMLELQFSSLARIIEREGLLSTGRLQTPEQIPGQRPAPIRVSVSVEGLHIVDSQHATGPLNEAARSRILAAASTLLRSAIAIVGTGGNIARGFLPPCDALRDALDREPESFSPEFVGILSRLIRKNIIRFDAELPDGAAEAFAEALNVTDTLVAQFEEWRNYLAAESGKDISSDQAQKIVSLARSVAAHLAENKGVVDPNIPSRIRAMIEPAIMQLVSQESIAVPVFFSLSNIMAAVSQAAISLGHVIEAGGPAAAGTALAIFATGFVQRFGEDAADIGLSFVKSVGLLFGRLKSLQARDRGSD